ncbi:MAG: hypothetical protein J5857_12260 [Treponema sp.]|nr:hypothetical protein [Treponema sp.]
MCGEKNPYMHGIEEIHKKHYYVPMNRKNRIIKLLLGVLFTGHVFASAISGEAQKKIDEFMKLRMEITACSTQQEALSKVEAFEKQFQPQKSSFNQEENLIIDNFIILEKYNCYSKMGWSSSNLRNIMKTQKEILEVYFKTNPRKQANKWLVCTYGDVLSCFMAFSVGDVLKCGLTVKDCYDSVIKEDPSFSYGLTNAAQWYYWAPGINGGSKKKAGQYFEKAVSSARNSAEKYFAEVFYSQYLLENKQKEQSTVHLDNARALCPSSKTVQELKTLNASGKSMFAASKEKSSFKDN